MDSETVASYAACPRCACPHVAALTSARGNRVLFVAGERFTDGQTVLVAYRQRPHFKICGRCPSCAWQARIADTWQRVRPRV